MTVYVDDMRAPVGRMQLCHMLADTPQELHAMADVIGCRRDWLHGDHYDIPRFRRAHALRLGAHAGTQRQLGLMRLYRRRHGYLPSPGQAEAWHQEAMYGEGKQSTGDGGAATAA